MPTPRKPRLANTPVPPTIRTAMMDLAAAFGHGARKGKRVVWTEKAILEGEGWLVDRFDMSTKNYWDVREEAIRVAYVVGMWAATNAQSRNSDVINDTDVRLALGKLGPPAVPGLKILREDCPF